MNTPRSLRLALSGSLLGSVLLTSTVFGLTPDEVEALRSKANRGNAIAQYNLGLAYANRDEPTYDPVQAYAWLSLAATSGTNSKMLDQVTDQLTAEQLQEGKRLLAALTASPVSPAPAPDSPIRPVDEPSSTGPTTASASAPAQATEADPEQKKLSAELAAAWKENELLKAGLNSRLADANKRIAIAEAALASKDKEIAALNTRLEAATGTPKADDSELTALRSERDRLQSAASSASAELAGLRTALEAANAEQASLREQLTNASSGLTEARRAQSLAEAEAASLKAAADRASAERLAVAAQLETATNELTAAKEAAAAQSSTPNPLAETVKTLERERDQLVAQLAEANQRASNRESALAAHEKEMESLRARIAAAPAEPDLVAARSERDRLAQTVKALEQERDTLTAQLAAAQPAVPADPAPAVVAAPIPPVPTAPATLDPETSERLVELEQAKADSDTKLEAALRSFTLQQSEIDRLQKALASIDEERAAAVAKIDALNAELNTLRPQAATAETVTADAERLRVELAAANERIANQASALDLANRNLTDARQTIDTATAELVATRDQLRQTQAQSAASANEVHQLKTRLALAGSLPAANAPSRPGALPQVALTPPPPPAGAVTPVAQPSVLEASAGPRIHTVAPGDSLSKISKQYYGTAGRWNEILRANQDVIRNPDSLSLGTKLRIP